MLFTETQDTGYTEHKGIENIHIRQVKIKSYYSFISIKWACRQKALLEIESHIKSSIHKKDKLNINVNVLNNMASKQSKY